MQGCLFRAFATWPALFRAQQLLDIRHPAEQDQDVVFFKGRFRGNHSYGAGLDVALAEDIARFLHF